MEFENISSKLQNIFKKMSGRGKLSEKEIQEAMREIKLALLEADVNYLVVKQFVKDVSERALGQEILESLTPGQQVVGIVSQELTKLMGEKVSNIQFGTISPAVILLCGLQGAGKTTMCAKLALYMKNRLGKKPLLAACDIYRPAAIDQLKKVGAQVDVPVFERGTQNPVITAQEAVREAQRTFRDVVILDTAGRLHIDEDMMNELGEIIRAVHPVEILLVVDAMTGQDAVSVAKTFNEQLELTGVILTKLDGDARGGAALSVRAVTGKPIKFSGIGEKLEDLEPFYPDRMASRILGMGDILTLFEKAQNAIDEKKAEELADHLRKNAFTLDDFLDQLEQMEKMGGMEDLVKMIPGVRPDQISGSIDEKQMARTKAIIQSMTRQERSRPEILNASRRKRIARGSGTSVQDVNRLMNQFQSIKQMMKQFSGGKLKRKMRGFKGLSGFGF